MTFQYKADYAYAEVDKNLRLKEVGKFYYQVKDGINTGRVLRLVYAFECGQVERVSTVYRSIESSLQGNFGGYDVPLVFFGDDAEKAFAKTEDAFYTRHPKLKLVNLLDLTDKTLQYLEAI